MGAGKALALSAANFLLRQLTLEASAVRVLTGFRASGCGWGGALRWAWRYVAASSPSANGSPVEAYLASRRGPCQTGSAPSAWRPSSTLAVM